MPLRTILALAATILAAAPARGQPEEPEVVRIVVDGAVSPASAEFIRDGIDDAADAGAAAVIIVLDTPGGLVESTRRIVQAILASPVPVIVYVAPSGARAGSAGVFLTLAAHVAAMAPGTNIGAATPVSMGGGGLPGTAGGSKPPSASPRSANAGSPPARAASRSAGSSDSLLSAGTGPAESGAPISSSAPGTCACAELTGGGAGA